MSQSDHPLRRSTATQETVKKPQAPTTSTPTAAPLDQLQRAVATPQNASPRAIATLQKQYGNRAVGGWLRRVQAKLNVGPVNDAYEQEADRVADAVMSSTAVPTTQRMEDEETVARTPDIQAKGDEGGFEVDENVETQLASRAGGGTALPDTTRDTMESRFGQDFSNVRIHADSGASQISRHLNAQAFTHGSDIYFGAGHYQPDNRQGQHLLAHELTHVVQQTGGVQRVIRRRSDKLPKKSVLTTRASGGHGFSKTKYDKAMDAIDAYHKLGSTLYLAQLQQLVAVYHSLVDWEIAHNLADSDATSKNKAEGKRRDVLSDVKSDFLPDEVADVYGQAKTATVTVPVPLMMQLMNTTDGKPGARATLQSDYATALQGYSASSADSLSADAVLRGKGATKLKEAGAGDSWTRDFNSMKNYDAQEEFGMYVSDVSTISPTSTMGKQMAEGNRNKQVATGMSEIEFLSLRAYSSHAYTEMNTESRRLNPSVKGDNKSDRGKSAKGREENQQLNLMATSALNKLPAWNGSPVYRGEDCAWGLKPSGPVQPGATVVLPSLTSTSATKSVAEGFSGSGIYNAVWEIQGIQNSGAQLGKFAAIQDIMSGKNSEDEILLKQYTRLQIVSVTPVVGKGYQFYIVATGN